MAPILNIVALKRSVVRKYIMLIQSQVTQAHSFMDVYACMCVCVSVSNIF